MTIEELSKFWKLTESHYIWIRVNEVLEDSYGVQVKIDYSVLLRHQRTKMLTTKRFVHKNIQVRKNENSKTRLEFDFYYCRHKSMVNYRLHEILQIEIRVY